MSEEIDDSPRRRGRARDRQQRKISPQALGPEQLIQLGAPLAVARVRCVRCHKGRPERFQLHADGSVVFVSTRGPRPFYAFVDLVTDRTPNGHITPAGGLCPQHGPLLVEVAAVVRALEQSAARGAAVLTVKAEPQLRWNRRVADAARPE